MTPSSPIPDSKTESNLIFNNIQVGVPFSIASIGVTILELGQLVTDPEHDKYWSHSSVSFSLFDLISNL